MIERISVYEFMAGNIYGHTIHNLECWKYDEKEQVIEKLFNKINLDKEEIVLYQSGDRYYVKEGMNLFYSLKGFMSNIFTYNGKKFSDMYLRDMTGLEQIFKSVYIKIRIVDGNEDELINILNSEEEIYENILYERMLSVEDNARESNKKWCILETVRPDTGGLKQIVLKEFDSKLEAWNYAKENVENVRNDDNIIVYKIGLVKKIGDEYELESYGAIKKYESIDVMREK